MRLVASSNPNLNAAHAGASMNTPAPRRWQSGVLAECCFASCPKDSVKAVINKVTRIVRRTSLNRCLQVLRAHPPMVRNLNLV